MSTRPGGCGYCLDGAETLCNEPGRLYTCGVRCDTHAPWALGGMPDPATLIDAARTAAALRPEVTRRCDCIELLMAASMQYREDADKAKSHPVLKNQFEHIDRKAGAYGLAAGLLKQVRRERGQTETAAEL